MESWGNQEEIYSYIKSKAKGHTNDINELKDHLGRLKQDATSKANILNDQFCSVFSNPSGVFTGNLDPSTKTPTMPHIIVNPKGVLNLINKSK